ncbi:MAG: adenylyltransferase/cytidyltransferase family protein [Candidatus Thalassarchaeaceae archaeon]|nr:adenylyltransferase/cytidyltransferase family protein [Candidatus Thalassarchaeaceae archaeon]
MSDLPLEPLPPEQPPESGVVVLGRFQPVHKGHALMIRAADDWRSANASDKGLIIAIGSSNQPPSIRNPWSSEERAAMLRAWLASTGLEAKIVAIPDIEDPPNWVSHAEKYHGSAGSIFTTDAETAELYESSGWQVIMGELEHRDSYEGWRVRATAQMLSTVHDEDGVRSVLGTSVPDAVVSIMLDEGSLGRLAFMGEGGEPVG